MMKKIKFITMLVLVLGVSAINVSFGQSRMGNGPVTPVSVGSAIFNVGLGIGNQYKGDYYNTPFGTKAALELGLWQAGPGVITLGGEIGASFSSGNFKARTVVLAARSAWHYGWQVAGLDTYGGLSTGLGFHHHDYFNYNGDKNELIPIVGVFLGASYFVTPNFGFNAETGSDITNFQVGIVYKLR